MAARARLNAETLIPHLIPSLKQGRRVESNGGITATRQAAASTPG
ncbi:hypothetical protein [Synechococcus sp. CCY9202]|nr:hypothetical protein [Synechococcus sp. CCY9202]MEA5422824.1 hypothetical protein [Synechococcus sp. CCY9202]